MNKVSKTSWPPGGGGAVAREAAQFMLTPSRAKAHGVRSEITTRRPIDSALDALAVALLRGRRRSSLGIYASSSSQAVLHLLHPLDFSDIANPAILRDQIPYTSTTNPQPKPTCHPQPSDVWRQTATTGPSVVPVTALRVSTFGDADFPHG